MRKEAHRAAAKVATFPSPASEHASIHASRGGDPASGDQADPLLAFTSEHDLVRDVRLGSNDEATSTSVGTRAKRFSWSHAAFAVLALVIVAQGALIFMRLQPRPAPPVPETGAVTVTSEPVGAPVSIDGVARGMTPFTLSLASGAHEVEVGRGANVRTQTVSVGRGGETSVHVELRANAPLSAPATGGLHVSSEPAGARVLVDGKPRGAAPLSVADLEPGAHTVRVVTAAGSSVTRTVMVEAGVVQSLIISMNARGEYASGWLAFTSAIPAQIFENGTLLGSTDTPRIMIPAGRHDLDLINRTLGYRAQRSVQVAVGQTTSITLDIPQGTVHVNALPWANVSIDGRLVGETPIGNLSLPLGTHEIVFRHPELGEQRRTVVVTAGTPLRVGVDLRKGQQ